MHGYLTDFVVTETDNEYNEDEVPLPCNIIIITRMLHLSCKGAAEGNAFLLHVGVSYRAGVV